MFAELHRCFRAAFRFAGIALALILLGATARALPAQGNLDEEVTFSIPAQPLGAALLKFSQQSGLQLLTSSDEIPETVSRELTGRLRIRAALATLLEGTGLTFSSISAGTIAIKELASKSSADSRGQLVQLARVHAAEATSTQAPQNSGAAGSTDDAVVEIIVTAQKREERLIETPQSVTVLSSESLRKLGALQLRDWASAVPGLTFTSQGAGLSQVSLRGLTTGNDRGFGQTTAGYVDEVPYGASSAYAFPNQVALDMALFDLDRIEVLRGPQGTLYGASTMGGLIKYVTRRPDTVAFGIEVQTGVSDTRDGGLGYHGAAAVNVPLADSVALRFNVFESHDGGYIDNVQLGKLDVNASDIYGARADLLLTPSSALTIRITAFAQNISRDGNAFTDFNAVGIPITAELEQRRALGESFDQRFRLASGTVTYDFGKATLTSISSYQTASSEFLSDGSSTYVPIFRNFYGRTYGSVAVLQNTQTDKFVQELRLASVGTGALEWMVGGFYTDEKSLKPDAGFVAYDAAGAMAPRDIYNLRQPSRYREYAAFGDLTWHIAAKWSATAGVRYAHNEQSFEQLGSGFLFTTAPTRASSESVATYLGNVRYRFNENATGYLRYATGYRPGGPNFVVNDATTGAPLASPTFDSDRLKSYEIGYRGQTSNRRFSVEVAAYHIDWDDIQIGFTRGGFGVQANSAGGATVRGAEFSLSARPTPALSFSGAFAYQDPRLSAADLNLRGARDERLPNVPHFMGTLSADYVLPVGELQPTLGATVRHVGERTTAFGATAHRMPEYATVDLRAGLSIVSVDLQLYAHNVMDKRGQVFTVAGNPLLVTIIQPRTIGLNAAIRF